MTRCLRASGRWVVKHDARPPPADVRVDVQLTRTELGDSSRRSERHAGDGTIAAKSSGGKRYPSVFARRFVMEDSNQTGGAGGDGGTGEEGGRFGRAKEFVGEKYAQASGAMKNGYNTVREKV